MVGTTPSFYAFEVPPLACATRDLMIPVLLGFISDSNLTIYIIFLQLVLIVLDCLFSA